MKRAIDDASQPFALFGLEVPRDDVEDLVFLHLRVQRGLLAGFDNFEHGHTMAHVHTTHVFDGDVGLHLGERALHRRLDAIGTAGHAAGVESNADFRAGFPYRAFNDLTIRRVCVPPLLEWSTSIVSGARCA